MTRLAIAAVIVLVAWLMARWQRETVVIRPKPQPWDHAYVADADGVCLECGWVGSYAHTEDFYRKWLWPASVA